MKHADMMGKPLAVGDLIVYSGDRNALTLARITRLTDTLHGRPMANVRIVRDSRGVLIGEERRVLRLDKALRLARRTA